MSNPKLSVIVSTYGRLEAFTNLVTSCRAAFPANSYEVIAVTSDPQDSYKGKWMREQPDVTVVQGDVRTGHRQRSLYAYENMGIKASTGDWLFITNDDTIIDQSFYAKLVEVEKDFDVILVNGHIGSVGLGRRIPSIGTITPPSGPTRALKLYDFSVIRRTVYDQIGYLDENLDWFGKGFDLAMACETQPNLRIAYASDLYVDHTLVMENRQPPHYVRDFQYTTDKWKTWCAANGWSFEWPW